MTPLGEAIGRLAERQDLSRELAHQAVRAIVDGQADDVQIGAFLLGLRQKGETFEELVGCARALREVAIAVRPSRGPLVDTCGTGGDGSSSLNLSTLAGLVAATCGVPVAKHGNRSVSSQCGSADLLEALGVPLLQDPHRAAACIDELGFGFLFAPYFHPATARVAGARRSLRIRTVFNLLGPLLNPAHAQIQLIGVYSPDWLEPVALLAAEMGSHACLVVHGEGGMDELTLHGPTQAVLWKDGGIRRLELDARYAGLDPGRLDDLAGGSPAENARRSQALLQGEQDPAADAVAYSAGACLWLAGQAENLRDGVAQAHQRLAAGAGWELIEKLRGWSG